jgi:hypothetical protein
VSVDTLYASVGRKPQLVLAVNPRSRRSCALVFAGEEDAACADAFRHIDERRAANMRVLVADLRTTGELRPDLDDDGVAALAWATKSWEYFHLLRRRGFTPRRYADHLADLWYRALAAAPSQTSQ